MIHEPATSSLTDDAAAELGDDARASELVDDELLVEEISIDGMCGVY